MIARAHPPIAHPPVRRDLARTTLPYAPLMSGPIARLADEVRALDLTPPAPKCANHGCLRPVASCGFCALCAMRMGVYDGR